MTQAQVQAAIALVMAIIISWAGLLMATALTLPGSTAKAQDALQTAPRRCFLHGLGLLLIFGVAVQITTLPFPILKLVGVLLMLALGGLAVLGAAGIAYLLGQRIGEMSGAKTSFGTLTRGSLLYGVAALFPLIGWYLFAPISVICALGAGAWAVKPERNSAARRSGPLVPIPTPDFDLAGH